MIFGQDAKAPFNDCNNLRGAILTADKFDTRHINKIAAGAQIHGFIVAPAISYEAVTPAGKNLGYHSYGVFAVDRDALSAWEEKSNKNKLGRHFNHANGRPDFGTEEYLLPTHSAAHEQAGKLNRLAYNDYLQDFQDGRLAGITQWNEKTPGLTTDRTGITLSPATPFAGVR